MTSRIFALSILIGALQAGCGGGSGGEGGSGGTAGHDGGGGSSGLSCNIDYPVGATCDSDVDCGAGAVCVTNDGSCKCAACAPKKLADGGYLFALAVDSTHVYWSDWDQVWKAPRDGGPSTKVVKLPAVDDDDFVTSIAVDGTALYIAWYSQGGNAVLEQPLDGGALTVLASVQSTPVSVVLDATHVYWVSFESGEVMKTPKSGGASTVIAGGQSSPSSVAVHQGDVYWTNAGDMMSGSGGAVMKLPAGGGAPVVVASEQGGPTALAVDDRGLYWVNSIAGTVMKLPFVCGAPVTLASGEHEPRGVAVDAHHIYWAEYTGQVRRALLDGGPAVRISDSMTSSRNGPIATDATGVYWVGSVVAKLSK
jgi:hypothetical protein